MPWISTQPFLLYEINPEAKTTSGMFGLVLVGLALGMRSAGARLPTGILLILAGALGVLGYGGFTLLGMNGFDDTSEFGLTTHVEFDPNVGLVSCIAGSFIAAVAAGVALRAPRR
jgi:hypothetical protein